MLVPRITTSFAMATASGASVAGNLIACWLGQRQRYEELRLWTDRARYRRVGDQVAKHVKNHSGRAEAESRDERSTTNDGSRIKTSAWSI